MNNHHVTYIIGTNINNYLSIIHFILLWNIKLFNHLPAIVAVIGRPVHRMASIATSPISFTSYAAFRISKLTYLDDIIM